MNIGAHRNCRNRHPALNTEAHRTIAETDFNSELDHKMMFSGFSLMNMHVTEVKHLVKTRELLYFILSQCDILKIYVAKYTE